MEELEAYVFNPICMPACMCSSSHSELASLLVPCLGQHAKKLESFLQSSDPSYTK